MNIRPKKEIKRVIVTISPNWKNNFIIPIKIKLSLPGEFYEGDDWIIKHPCSSCGNDVSIGKSSVNRIGILSIHRIKNIKILKALGNIFNLKLKNEIDENDFEIYNYSLTEKYKDIARIGYYTCQHCSTQYLFSYCDIDGDDDRHPEPDKVYIEKILQVEFDHKEFMKEIKSNTTT